MGPRWLAGFGPFKTTRIKERIVALSIGDTARDRITGFEGVVVGTSIWIDNCRRFWIQPTKLGDNGKPIEMESFDEGRLELVKAAEKPHTPVNHGGPMNEPRPRERR